MPPVDDVDDEDAQVIKYFAEKALNATAPLKKAAVLREFIETDGTKFKFGIASSRFYNHLIPKIHQTTSIDMETKVRIMFALSIPVEEYFLKELKKHAEVRVDVVDRIVKYKSKNGSLMLNGVHCRLSNYQIICYNKKKEKLNAMKQEEMGTNFDMIEIKQEPTEAVHTDEEMNEEPAIESPDRNAPQTSENEDMSVAIRSFSQSMDSLMRNQTYLLNELVRRQSLDPPGSFDMLEYTPPSFEEAIDDEIKNAKRVMKTLNSFVLTLDSPLLANIENQLELQVEKFRVQDEKIAVETIDMALKSALFIIAKEPNRMEVGEKWHLKAILKMFKRIVVCIDRNGHDLETLKEKIRMAIELAESGDEILDVSVTRIQKALEIALNIIMI